MIKSKKISSKREKKAYDHEMRRGCVIQNMFALINLAKSLQTLKGTKIINMIICLSSKYRINFLNEPKIFEKTEYEYLL